MADKPEAPLTQESNPPVRENPDLRQPMQKREDIIPERK
jgi:hypothetical protein